MFDEEGNGLVKTDELEKLMSLMGINPTKRELVTMAKEVDKDSKNLSRSYLLLYFLPWNQCVELPRFCGSQEEFTRQDRP